MLTFSYLHGAAEGNHGDFRRDLLTFLRYNVAHDDRYVVLAIHDIAAINNTASPSFWKLYHAPFYQDRDGRIRTENYDRS